MADKNSKEPLGSQSLTPEQLKRAEHTKNIQQGKFLPEIDYAIIKMGFTQYVLPLNKAYEVFKIFTEGEVEIVTNSGGGENAITPLLPSHPISLNLMTRQDYAILKMNKFFSV